MFFGYATYHNRFSGKNRPFSQEWSDILLYWSKPFFCLSFFHLRQKNPTRSEFFEDKDVMHLHLRYIEMGNRIRLRRKELHLKQGELARLLSISNNHMSAIESGKQKTSIDTFLNLCEVLKVTPDYLLLGSMHANNVSKDISDMLRLCSPSDLALAREFIELLVARNRAPWNEEHFI